ncbi:hypothetical protein AQUCO_10900026v1 [Aquilegia coerulea]|uniref:Serine carboxypeptidase-like 18 n=1 Tax=Aquilegia coerulea TaxID=218851 RepID=A0A2G5C342_AQUCA|nr:hypothetical protein AQUCO_10900026v1 [Aquilegia coerulea]
MTYLSLICESQLSNIVILDSPVGAGFSYSRSLQGFYSTDTKSAKQAYTFIRKWLLDHPEFLSNPLYIGGHSYSGRTVPVIVQDISDGIEAGDKPLINLKGYLLGNPVTDRYIDGNSLVPFAYGMGIISYEIYESAKKNCGGDYVNVDPSNVQCGKNLQVVSKCTEGLYDKNILEPKCLPIDIVRDRRSLRENSTRQTRSPPPDPGLECRTTYGYMLSYYWANDDRVQTTLNIRKGTVQEWIRCNLYDIHYLSDVESSIGYHLNLSKRHYRSLIYSGDHDMIIPFIGTQAWIRSLNYSISDDWRPWLVNSQVAGYTRTYSNNMTYATVKWAGHIAPEYKPRECFAMFEVVVV